MTEEQYLSLCEKYLRGDHTLQEEQLLKDYQARTGLADDTWEDKLMGDQQRVKALLQQKIQQSLHPVKARVISIHKWWYAAAAILMIMAAGGYFIRTNTKTHNYAAANPVPQSNTDIQPASNKAVLTLANGKSITLDSAGNGLLGKQGGTIISKTGNGLVIKNNHSTKNPDVAATALNNITIPRGGKYDITLPDGTRVWLNSASSLTFPVAFTGTERKVTLTGEAYFEVAKNKTMPFKINVNNKQVVEVLGTHFNITAYTDEQHINTTLLEGSVKINYQNQSTLITPGQMAVNNLTNNGITIKSANIEEVMAWRNGIFMFDNENITSIMKKISRWYDVDIAFKGDMEKVNVTGNYARTKSLSNLIKNIELMDKVHFVVEGRRLTVISK